MVTTIFLIRHGELDNPQRIIYGPDISLSPKGLMQMESLAKRLRERSYIPIRIYTSPFKRALQSARKIREVYGNIEIVVKHGLRDTDDTPIIGRSLDWLKSIGGDIYNSEELRGLSIEKPELIVNRMIVVIKEIQEKNRGETVFVVSHGDSSAFALWRLLHPEGQLPSISELAKSQYLKKGEAFRIVFDGNGKVVENELISREEDLVKGEREY